MPNTENEFDTGAPAVESVAPAPVPDSAEALKKKVYMGFGATIAVALVLAGLYVGGRVFAARGSAMTPPVKTAAIVNQPTPLIERPIVAEKPTPLAPGATQPATPPPPALVATVSPEPKAAAPAPPAAVATIPVPEPPKSEPSAVAAQPVRKLVNPQPKEMYLQLAALGPKALDKYLPEAEAQGLHPVVAPGPDATVFRVLVGPFPDKDTLHKQEQALQEKGLQPMVRIY